jgi:DNA polymerase-3 subunit beta
VDDKIVFSATDLFRISQKTIILSEKQNEEINITIPYKTLLELPKLLENAKTLKIVNSDGYVTFIINNVLFQSNLIDGQFPNVGAAFPTDFSTVIYVESKKLLKTLNRADLPNDDGLPQIINLRLENDLIYVKSTVCEVGNYEEEFKEFKLEGTGNLVISFNSKFLLDALKTFDNEPIKLQFINATRPVVITKQSNEELKQVVLPTYLGN